MNKMTESKYKPVTDYIRSRIEGGGADDFRKLVKDLYDVRKYLHNGDYDGVSKVYDGIFAPFVKSKDDAHDLEDFLKETTNEMHGMTIDWYRRYMLPPEDETNGK